MANNDSDIKLLDGQVKVETPDLCVDSPLRRSNNSPFRRVHIHNNQNGLPINLDHDYFQVEDNISNQEDRSHRRPLMKVILLLVALLSVVLFRVHAQANVVRAHDASAGAISRVAISSLKGDLIVTAVRDGSGNLKLIVWYVDATSNILRKGSASAGVISEVALTAIGNRVVTAVRDGGGNLKLIVWEVDTNGNISRKGDASAGAISKVTVNSIGSNRVVTAVRDGSGNLKIITWDVDTNGNISRKGDASAGAISAVSSTLLSPDPTKTFRRLVTAVRDGSGNLKVIAWDIDWTGKVVRKGDASAGAISKVAVTTYGPTTFHTFVRDGAGNLKVIGWSISQYGAITRLGDNSAGAITEVAATGSVSACRGGDGNLKLIWWDTVNDQPQYIGSASAGDISQVAVTGGLSFINIGVSFKAARVVTAVRDGGGNLKLISWHLVYSTIS
jgi:hypothetical protein